MGKFCLAKVWSARQEGLLGCALLLVALGAPAEAASNQTGAVLHIQVTVVPTVHAATAQQSTSNRNAPVVYDLQPSSTTQMTSQVTGHSVVPKRIARRVKSSGKPASGAVLQTTTVVAE